MKKEETLNERMPTVKIYFFYLLDEKKQMVGHWKCVNTGSRGVAMALINWRLIEGFERSISRIYSQENSHSVFLHLLITL